MKKLITPILILFTIVSLSASTTIKGDFSLNGTLNLDESFNYSIDSSANMNLYLFSKSNNVRYTIKNNTTISISDTTNKFEQAYLQFRNPYKENHLTFTFGKTPLDIGSFTEFNSGTPFNIIDGNPWIASVKAKLFELKDFQSINLELIAKLPLEDGDTKVGSRITYDINNYYFGTMEATFLSDFNDSILCGGINGNLFFDYGVYGKADLQDLNNFETSTYLLKMYPKFTYKVEAIYINSVKSLSLLSSISYIIDTKSSLTLSSLNLFEKDNWRISPSILFNFNILQGLDFSINYSYMSKTKINSLTAIVTHKF